MTVLIALIAFVVIVGVGLCAICWDWIDDHRIEISLSMLIAAVLVSAWKL